MTEPVDLMKPWTIKSVATRVSDEITARARRDGLTTGQLVERIWDAWNAAGQPVSVGAPDPRPIDLAGMCEMVRTAVALSAHTGKPVRSDLQGRFAGLVEQELRAARGMPPAPKPRPPTPPLLTDESS